MTTVVSVTSTTLNDTKAIPFSQSVTKKATGAFLTAANVVANRSLQQNDTVPQEVMKCRKKGQFKAFSNTQCHSCGTEFGGLVFRHKCLQCKSQVCGQCSPNVIFLFLRRSVNFCKRCYSPTKSNKNSALKSTSSSFKSTSNYSIFSAFSNIVQSFKSEIYRQQSQQIGKAKKKIKGKVHVNTKQHQQQAFFAQLGKRCSEKQASSNSNVNSNSNSNTSSNSFDIILDPYTVSNQTVKLLNDSDNFLHNLWQRNGNSVTSEIDLNLKLLLVEERTYMRCLDVLLKHILLPFHSYINDLINSSAETNMLNDWVKCQVYVPFGNVLDTLARCVMLIHTDTATLTERLSSSIRKNETLLNFTPLFLHICPNYLNHHLNFASILPVITSYLINSKFHEFVSNLNNMNALNGLSVFEYLDMPGNKLVDFSNKLAKHIHLCRQVFDIKPMTPVGGQEGATPSRTIELARTASYSPHLFYKPVDPQNLDLSALFIQQLEYLLGSTMRTLVSMNVFLINKNEMLMNSMKKQFALSQVRRRRFSVSLKREFGGGCRKISLDDIDENKNENSRKNNENNLVFIEANLDGRALIHEGDLSLIVMDKSTHMASISDQEGYYLLKKHHEFEWNITYHVHLFNDAVLISELVNDQYQIKFAFKLDEIRIFRNTMSGFDNSFQLVSNQVDIEFCCRNARDRFIWLRYLYRQQDRYLSDDSNIFTIGIKNNFSSLNKSSLDNTSFTAPNSTKHNPIVIQREILSQSQKASQGSASDRQTTSKTMKTLSQASPLTRSTAKSKTKNIGSSHCSPYDSNTFRDSGNIEEVTQEDIDNLRIDIDAANRRRSSVADITSHSKGLNCESLTLTRNRCSSDSSNNRQSQSSSIADQLSQLKIVIPPRPNFEIRQPPNANTNNHSNRSIALPVCTPVTTIKPITNENHNPNTLNSNNFKNNNLNFNNSRLNQRMKRYNSAFLNIKPLQTKQKFQQQRSKSSSTLLVTGDTNEILNQSSSNASNNENSSLAANDFTRGSSKSMSQKLQNWDSKRAIMSPSLPSDVKINRDFNCFL